MNSLQRKLLAPVVVSVFALGLFGLIIHRTRMRSTELQASYLALRSVLDRSSSANSVANRSDPNMKQSADICDMFASMDQAQRKAVLDGELTRADSLSLTTQKMMLKFIQDSASDNQTSKPATLKGATILVKYSHLTDSGRGAVPSLEVHVQCINMDYHYSLS